jgi:coproporphyrinogen III oxidase-like Fe-S oxidoreductase
LGRVHSALEAERAIDLARAVVPRVSADLIVGLQDQTDAEIEADLGIYDRHDLDHASVYHLTYEPGTEFHARLQRGDLAEIDPERSRSVLVQVSERLAERGLQRYETSNFAKPGHESRHNLAYWLGRDYQAAGAGAVSTIAGIRRTREKHPARYISAITAGNDATWRHEQLTAEELLREAWMLGLRLADGLPLARVDALGDNPARYQSRIAGLAKEGFVISDGERVRLSATSWPLLDEIAVHLMP